jgi:hypothetical protein
MLRAVEFIRELERLLGSRGQHGLAEAGDRAAVLALGRIAWNVLEAAKGSPEAAAAFLAELEMDALVEEYRSGKGDPDDVV